MAKTDTIIFPVGISSNFKSTSTEKDLYQGRLPYTRNDDNIVFPSSWRNNGWML